MHININFILLQEFDVEYYFICFILILKVKFISKMKWKCIFSEISPQSNPLRELITPPTKLAGPGGRPCRPTGGDCRVSRADYVSTQPYRVHSLDNAKTGEYRRYMLAAWQKAAGLVHQCNSEKTVSITSRTIHFDSWYVQLISLSCIFWTIIALLGG